MDAAAFTTRTRSQVQVKPRNVTHLAFVTWPAVGHVTPMMDFASALLASDPDMCISFLTSPDMVEYLDRAGLGGKSFGDRLRIVTMGDESLGENPLATKVTTEDEPMKLAAGSQGVDKNTVLLKTMRSATQIAVHFREKFPILLADQEMPECGLKPTGAPVSAVICNWMTFGIDKLVKAMSPKTKLFAFFDHSSYFSTRLLGPRSIGGFGNTASLWANHCRETGQVDHDKDELERLFGRRFGEQLYHVPGTNIEPIMDKACSPQAPAYLLDIPVTPSLLNIQGLVEHSDGLLINTYGSIEKTILDYLQGHVHKPIVPVGPIMLQEADKKRSAADDKMAGVNGFLGKQTPGSVLYVSFGTLFRPNPEQLVVMIDTLLDELADVPFIWTLGGQKSLTAELHGVDSVTVDRLNSKIDAAVASGKVHICNWVDQNAVLNHPNIGYFLTHGGWNSATEAVLAGKPMIVFPFFGDQLFTAKLLEGHGVAKVIHSARDQPLPQFHRNVLDNLGFCRGGDYDTGIAAKAKALQASVIAERGDASRDSVLDQLSTLLEV